MNDDSDPKARQDDDSVERIDTAGIPIHEPQPLPTLEFATEDGSISSDDAYASCVGEGSDGVAPPTPTNKPSIDGLDNDGSQSSVGEVSSKSGTRVASLAEVDTSFAAHSIPEGALSDGISEDGLSDTTADDTASTIADDSSLVVLQKIDSYISHSRADSVCHIAQANDLHTNEDSNHRDFGKAPYEINTVKDSAIDGSSHENGHCSWVFDNDAFRNNTWHFGEEDVDEPAPEIRSKKPDPIWTQYPQAQYPRFDMALNPTDCDGTEATLASRAYPMPSPGSLVDRQVWVIVSSEFSQAAGEGEDDDESSVDDCRPGKAKTFYGWIPRWRIPRLVCMGWGGFTPAILHRQFRGSKIDGKELGNWNPVAPKRSSSYGTTFVSDRKSTFSLLVRFKSEREEAERKGVTEIAKQYRKAVAAEQCRWDVHTTNDFWPIIVPPHLRGKTDQVVVEVPQVVDDESMDAKPCIKDVEQSVAFGGGGQDGYVSLVPAGCCQRTCFIPC
ncbi:hypothetical protein HYQ46_011554 [Verticillium longisporum]|nr:hypothetical protein HYQ46_011554 [Verticillium longisporum]